MCKVWSRPDVDRETGATFASEKVAVFERLVAMPRALARACLFDLRRAPPSWGPVTQTALERSLRLWEEAGRRIAVVTSEDPLQTLQLRLLIRQQAPTQGKLFSDPDLAFEWLLQTSTLP